MTRKCGLRKKLAAVGLMRRAFKGCHNTKAIVLKNATNTTCRFPLSLVSIGINIPRKNTSSNNAGKTNNVMGSTNMIFESINPMRNIPDETPTMAAMAM